MDFQPLNCEKQMSFVYTLSSLWYFDIAAGIDKNRWEKKYYHKNDILGGLLNLFKETHKFPLFEKVLELKDCPMGGKDFVLMQFMHLSLSYITAG